MQQLFKLQQFRTVGSLLKLLASYLSRLFKVVLLNQTLLKGLF